MYHVLRGETPADLHDDRESLFRIKLAALDGYFMDRLSPDVDAAFQAALELLRDGGVELSSASLAHAGDIAPVYLHLVLADAAAYHATTLAERPHAYTPNVRIRLEMGRHVLGEDYVRALRGRDVIRNEVDRALAAVDALVLPALSIEAPPIGALTVPVKGGQELVRSAMLRCTQPFNLSGHPAISVPCGATAAGLPVGLQVVGKAGNTVHLLRIARAIERTVNRRG